MFSLRKGFFIFFLVCFLSVFAVLSASTSRLLVSIDPEASFSPEEFAKASSATLLLIEPRNPYKIVENVFLDKPFVVLSHHITEKDIGWGSTVLEHLSSRHGYRLVIFKNESLDEATKIAQHLLSMSPKYSSELTRLTVQESTRLYSLMKKIDKVLTENKVKYWAGRETLLGAIRHGGLVPWDDYLHLFILDSEKLKLESVKADFEKEGLVLHSYFKDFYKVCEVDGLPLQDHFNNTGTLPFTYPAANIFVMTLEKRKESQDVYVHSSFNFYFNWNHERFAYSQIENISRIPFGPISLPIPGSPEEYLNRMFGTEKRPDLWKKYAVEPLWDHRNEKDPTYSGAALVEIDNFAPAPWH
ncbi:MAG: hypothetical protein HKM07_01395 [Chlamydiae bacterium]|nr:hypothetical protein [Chlamydiota bacterium]